MIRPEDLGQGSGQRARVVPDFTLVEPTDEELDLLSREADE